MAALDAVVRATVQVLRDFRPPGSVQLIQRHQLGVFRGSPINKIKNSVNWVSYLPSMTQVMRMNDALKEQQFQDIEIKEVILRDWVVDEKIVRPSNKLVSHTGFLISANYIKY